MDVAPFIQQIQKSLEDICKFQGTTASRIEEIAKDVSEVVQRQKEFELAVDTRISHVCARLDTIEQKQLISDTEKKRDKYYLMIITGLVTFIVTIITGIAYLYEMGGRNV